MNPSKLTAFATRYAAAWSGQNPADPTSCYVQHGSLTVNAGSPSVGRAAGAAAYLSSNTFQYYEEMRDLALYANEADLKERSTIDVMQVLVMRHRIPADSLQRMNGVELLTHALNNGWIGKESGAWKLDLMPLMRSAALFEGLATEREMTREEFVLAVLSSIGGSVVDNSIWTPPLQRDAAD